MVQDAEVMLVEQDLEVMGATELIVDTAGMGSVAMQEEVMAEIVVPVEMQEERAVLEVHPALVVEGEEGA